MALALSCPDLAKSNWIVATIRCDGNSAPAFEPICTNLTCASFGPRNEVEIHRTVAVPSRPSSTCGEFGFVPLNRAAYACWTSDEDSSATLLKCIAASAAVYVCR